MQYADPYAMGPAPMFKCTSSQSGQQEHHYLFPKEVIEG